MYISGWYSLGMMDRDINQEVQRILYHESRVKCCKLIENGCLCGLVVIICMMCGALMVWFIIQDV